ncbi:MAG: beta-glucanase (GH16 family) [Saprospiraceae bacterium]|jgi:beta-glucanase (GH16 family)
MKFTKILPHYLVLFLLFPLFSACGSDDDNPEVSASIFMEDVSIFEGNSGMTSFTFKILATQQVTAPVTIEFTTQDGSAIAGEDFVSQSGTATIPTGTREALVIIEVFSDTIVETDEDFTLVISNAVNATFTSNTATGTIQNDDIDSPVDDGYTTPTSYPGYTLNWADEFNGTALNLADWNYETGNSGWGNNELQNYVSGTNNAYLENGKLVLEAKNESSNGSNYSSARLTTQGKQSFEHGRVDIRAKLPQGQGIWPALWMLGERFSTVGWPACGEIDIMEIVGHVPNKVHGTIHWDNAGAYASYGGDFELSSGVFADEFHVFSIIWNTSEIKWYMDDILYNTADVTPSGLSEFHEPFFFIFNIAVGGNWPGSPDASTIFSQTMEVDYIRMFQ